MALTASALITAAKQRAFGAVGQQSLSNAMLLEDLTGHDTQVIQFFAQNAPDLAAIAATDTVTLAENQSGYTLQSGIHYRDFTHVDPVNDVYTPIHIVQEQHRERPGTAPAAFLNLSGGAAVFYPIDAESKRWQSTGDRTWFEENDSHEIHYKYVPLVSTITTLASAVASPDMARDVLVNALVMSIILANPQAPPTRLEAAMSRYTQSMSNMMMQAYKFTHPSGSRGGPYGKTQTSADWIQSQIG